MKSNKRAERRAIKEAKSSNEGYKKRNRIKGETKKPKHKKLDY